MDVMSGLAVATDLPLQRGPKSALPNEPGRHSLDRFERARVELTRILVSRPSCMLTTVSCAVNAPFFPTSVKIKRFWPA